MKKFHPIAIYKTIRVSRKAGLLLLLNAAVIIAVMLWAYTGLRNLPKPNLSLENFIANHLDYRAEGHSFYVDDFLKDSGEKKEILWGPFTGLKTGSYTAMIEYSAEEDQSCSAGAESEESHLVRSTPGMLSRHLHKEAYQFEVTDDIEKFDFRINYSGNGDFSVKSLSIISNNNRIKRISTEMIAALILFDFFCIFLSFSEDRKRVIVLLSGITMLVSLPLALEGMYTGPDLNFHLLRIEAIVQALRSGQFPARVSSIAMYGLGYPFSIFYNDLFLYFPAVLRLLGFPVISAYKIFLFCVNLAVVIISYRSFRKIICKQDLSIVLCLLYSASSYRLNQMYVRAGVGECTALIFFPLLAQAVHQIYTEETTGPGRIFKNASVLAVAMSGIIGSQVPSAIIVCFVLALMWLVLLKKSIRKSTLITFVAAVFLTILLNLYFVVPFLDYYITMPIAVKQWANDPPLLIQYRGVFLSQLFAFFRNHTGSFPPTEHDVKMMHTPGIALLWVFLYEVYHLLVKGKTEKRMAFYLFFSFLTIFISTDLFPWDFFTRHVPLWRYLTQILFPWRFLSVAMLLLCLMAGYLFMGPEKKLQDITVAVTVVTVLIFNGILYGQRELVNIFDTTGVEKNPIYYEYFIEGSSLYEFDTEVRGVNMDSAEILSQNSNTLKLYCKAGNEGGIHSVTAPLYNYKGYHVLDDAGNEYEIQNGEQNFIRFDLPDGFSGTITVIFKDPFYWTAALIISCATALFLLLCRFTGFKSDPNPVYRAARE